MKKFTCDCAEGYTGIVYETDVNECESSPCENCGTCNDNKVNMFTCDCVGGYTGTTCETDIDECDSSPCEHHGTCCEGFNMFVCDCTTGYTGIVCETDVKMNVKADHVKMVEHA